MATKGDILDMQFVDARCKLIDLAAFLDRIDRHEGEEDARIAALRRALPILQQQAHGRAAAVLESFSDHSQQIPESAPFQGAFGAPMDGVRR